MLRLAMTLGVGIAFFVLAGNSELNAQQNAPVARQAAPAGVYGQYGGLNMERFYHYPYVTYPHNYWGREYFRSNGSMYHRYPTEMRVPIYNRDWMNYYPAARRYHWGHHFILDVF